jgi:hypothetical protein
MTKEITPQESTFTLALTQSLVDDELMSRCLELNEPRLPYTYNTQVAGFSAQVAEKTTPLTGGDEMGPPPNTSSQKAA